MARDKARESKSKAAKLHKAEKKEEKKALAALKVKKLLDGLNGYKKVEGQKPNPFASVVIPNISEEKKEVKDEEEAVLREK